MNKHTLTAPAPQRQLGSFITLCLLAACIFLLSTCNGKSFDGKHIDVIKQSHNTGISHDISGKTSLFALPNGFNMLAFFRESRISRRIMGDFIAIHVIKHENTITSNSITAKGIDCTTIPFGLSDYTFTRTRLYILRNELFYLLWSTRINLLFNPLLSFGAVEQKHRQAYNENQKSEPEQSGLEQFYRRHGRCLIG